MQYIFFLLDFLLLDKLYEEHNLEIEISNQSQGLMLNALCLEKKLENLQKQLNHLFHSFYLEEILNTKPQKYLHCESEQDYTLIHIA